MPSARRLRLAPCEKVYTGVQPFEVRTCRYADKCRAAKFVRGSLRKCASRLLRPLNATSARDDLMEAQHLARQAAITRSRQEIVDPLTVCAIGMAKRMGEQKCSFAFPEVSVDLLSVFGNIAIEVEQVVSDLKRQSQEIAESIKPTEIRVVTVG